MFESHDSLCNIQLKSYTNKVHCKCNISGIITNYFSFIGQVEYNEYEVKEEVFQKSDAVVIVLMLWPCTVPYSRGFVWQYIKRAAWEYYFIIISHILWWLPSKQGSTEFTLVTSTVSSPFPVCPIFGDSLINSLWIPSKCTSSWIQELYLLSLSACRHLGLLHQKFTHTLHDTCTWSSVMLCVLCFDTLILVHCYIIGVTSAEPATS